MTNLSINRHTVNDNGVRLAVAGEVDLSTCDRLEQAILNTLAADHLAVLVVDFDKVTFLDSTGITALISGRNTALERGVTYQVINTHGIVQRTLDITGVLNALQRC
jgi:anti-sigma B factor antagonist